MISYLGQVEVTKELPQVVNGVKPHHSRDKEANKFNAGGQTYANTCGKEPEEPGNRERPLPEGHEADVTEEGQGREKEQHGVEENEAAQLDVGDIYHITQ